MRVRERATISVGSRVRCRYTWAKANHPASNTSEGRGNTVGVPMPRGW